MSWSRIRLKLSSKYAVGCSFTHLLSFGLCLKTCAPPKFLISLAQPKFFATHVGMLCRNGLHKGLSLMSLTNALLKGEVSLRDVPALVGSAECFFFRMFFFGGPLNLPCLKWCQVLSQSVHQKNLKVWCFNDFSTLTGFNIWLKIWFAIRPMKTHQSEKDLWS